MQHHLIFLPLIQRISTVFWHIHCLFQQLPPSCHALNLSSAKEKVFPFSTTTHEKFNSQHKSQFHLYFLFQATSNKLPCFELKFKPKKKVFSFFYNNSWTSHFTTQKSFPPFCLFQATFNKLPCFELKFNQKKFFLFYKLQNNNSWKNFLSLSFSRHNLLSAFLSKNVWIIYLVTEANTYGFIYAYWFTN